jgi:hypothetical protein
MITYRFTYTIGGKTKSIDKTADDFGGCWEAFKAQMTTRCYMIKAIVLVKVGRL